jgi:hypothetical protein
MLVTDLMAKFDGVLRGRLRFLDRSLCQIAARKIAHGLRFVPLAFAFAGEVDRLLEKSLRVVEISMKDLQLAERVEDAGDVNVVLVDREVERTLDDRLGARPLAGQYEINAEVVVRDYRIEYVLGLVEKTDRLFKTFDTVLRPRKNQYAPDMSV